MWAVNEVVTDRSGAEFVTQIGDLHDTEQGAQDAADALAIAEQADVFTVIEVES